jgi:hypothetical protein
LSAAFSSMYQAASTFTPFQPTLSAPPHIPGPYYYHY